VFLFYFSSFFDGGKKQKKKSEEEEVEAQFVETSHILIITPPSRDRWRIFL
tara:strand:- start:167 stop:319 length:153 start_codon:yes stop_codon:yes gene_type:complete